MRMPFRHLFIVALIIVLVIAACSPFTSAYDQPTQSATLLNDFAMDPSLESGGSTWADEWSRMKPIRSRVIVPVARGSSHIQR